MNNCVKCVDGFFKDHNALTCVAHAATQDPSCLDNRPKSTPDGKCYSCNYKNGYFSVQAGEDENDSWEICQTVAQKAAADQAAAGASAASGAGESKSSLVLNVSIILLNAILLVTL